MSVCAVPGFWSFRGNESTSYADADFPVVILRTLRAREVIHRGRVLRDSWAFGRAPLGR
jgi:hypothetical protein